MMASTYSYDFAELHGGRMWIDSLSADPAPVSSLEMKPDDLLQDLLDVAVAVYAADRLSRRRVDRKEDPEGLVQGRRMHLSIPVRNYATWKSDDVRTSLTDTLESLTFDVWDISFSPRIFPVVSQPRVIKHRVESETAYVALFSGGLDSLAGLLIEADNRPSSVPVLAVDATNNRQRHLQDRILQELKESHLPNLRWVPYLHSLDKRAAQRVPERRQEKSQRSRGFLFLAFGAVTAALIDRSELLVFENGIGAINLPYTRASGGADHTRSMHPAHLNNMSRFISLLTGRQFFVHNPCLWHTKGQMVSQTRRFALDELLLETVSCDGFPLRKKKRQCGRCTSCLLRRVALSTGGLDDGIWAASSDYLHDVLQLPADDSDDTLFPLKFMLAQVERLRSGIQDSEPVLALLREFPELYEVRASAALVERLPISIINRRLLRLFESYVREWEAFSVRLSAAGRNRRALRL